MKHEMGLWVLLVAGTPRSPEELKESSEGIKVCTIVRNEGMRLQTPLKIVVNVEFFQHSMIVSEMGALIQFSFSSRGPHWVQDWLTNHCLENTG